MVDAELRTVLAELQDLLDDVGERFWARWARERAAALAWGRLEPHDLRYVLGGLGSLNDLVLHPANGHDIDRDDVDELNARLTRLRAHLWQLTG